VCIAVPAWPPVFSGHGIQMSRNVPLLVERGLDVTVLTSHAPGDAPSSHIEHGARIERILTPGGGRANLIRRIRQARRFFTQRGRDFDLVHTMIMGWETFLTLPVIHRQGLPVAAEMVLLGTDDPETIARMSLGSLKLRSLRRIDAWIGISQAFLPRIRAVGLPEDRFHLVYIGVDLEKYRIRPEAECTALRERLDLPPDGRVAVTCGAVFARKGMDRVVRAWVETGPEPGRDMLLIVGPNDREPHREMVEWIRRYTEEHGATETVRMTGFVENLEDYLAAADLFVLRP
jgi:glycosyltransferase involved in cell wall biosynthesis